MGRFEIAESDGLAALDLPQLRRLDSLRLTEDAALVAFPPLSAVSSVGLVELTANPALVELDALADGAGSTRPTPRRSSRRSGRPRRSPAMPAGCRRPSACARTTGSATRSAAAASRCAPRSRTNSTAASASASSARCQNVRWLPRCSIEAVDRDDGRGMKANRPAASGLARGRGDRDQPDRAPLGPPRPAPSLRLTLTGQAGTGTPGRGLDRSRRVTAAPRRPAGGPAPRRPPRILGVDPTINKPRRLHRRAPQGGGRQARPTPVAPRPGRPPPRPPQHARAASGPPASPKTCRCRTSSPAYHHRAGDW